MELRRFRLPKIEISRSPLTNRGVRALAIVLAAIVLVSTAAYFGLVRQNKEKPSVLPAATTQEGEVIEPEPTKMPTVVVTEEPTVAASPTATATESPPTD